MAKDFTRQLGIINQPEVAGKRVVLIGAGAIGSFTALALTKLGVEKLTVYDDDEITEHNLPNQFYPTSGVGFCKTRVLGQVIDQFNGVKIKWSKKRYKDQQLAEVTIVATDSMASRKLVFDQFKKQKQTRYLLEARMGGEIGFAYCINKKSKKQMSMYKKTLYTDDQVAPLGCTERSIIYNVLMISSLLCRAFKSLVNKEKDYPCEVIFDLRTMTLIQQRGSEL